MSGSRILRRRLRRWNIINDGVIAVYEAEFTTRKQQIIVMHKDKGNGIVMMLEFACGHSFLSPKCSSGTTFLSLECFFSISGRRSTTTRVGANEIDFPFQLSLIYGRRSLCSLVPTLIRAAWSWVLTSWLIFGFSSAFDSSGDFYSKHFSFRNARTFLLPSPKNFCVFTRKGKNFVQTFSNGFCCTLFSVFFNPSNLSLTKLLRCTRPAVVAKCSRSKW